LGGLQVGQAMDFLPQELGDQALVHVQVSLRCPAEMLGMLMGAVADINVISHAGHPWVLSVFHPAISRAWNDSPDPVGGQVVDGARQRP